MDKNLSTRVAELFTPKQGKHKHDPITSPINGCVQVCLKCQEEHPMMDGSIYEATCSVPDPDPIDITDLGKALECFRGLWKGVGFQSFIEKVFYKQCNMETSEKGIYRWLVYKATAEQIWEICCLSKERGTENE